MEGEPKSISKCQQDLHQNNHFQKENSQTIVIFLVIHFAEIILGQDANWFWTCKDAVNPRQRKYGN